MVVTEEEAKTKWCPNSMDEDGGNRFFDVNEKKASFYSACLCIGSKCMWWEWNADKDKGYCGVTKKVAR